MKYLFHRTTLISAGLICLLHVPRASAFVPEELVAKGKVLAAGGHFQAAAGVFDQALALDPQNHEARFWSAVARLSAVVSSPEANGLLTTLGVSEGGRELRNWTADWSHDTNGNPMVPAGVGSEEVVTFLRNTVLPELQAAGQQLSLIDDPDFRIHLAEGQLWSQAPVPPFFSLQLWMTSENVWIDHADVQNLRFLLKFYEYVIHTVQAWNVEVQFDTLREMEVEDLLSVESVLETYPNLLTFSSPGDLAAARQAFEEGFELFTNAFFKIQARPQLVHSFVPGSSLNLFNYDPTKAEAAAQFMQTLRDVRLSLSAPTVITSETNLTVHLARWFDGTATPRELLPDYLGSVAVAGTLDPTLGGALEGFSPTEMDEAYAEFWAMGSALYPTVPSGDGLLQLRFNVLAWHAYAVEFSSDLTNWLEVAEFTATNSLHWFTFGPGLNEAGYLRLRDLSAEFASFYGTVADACTSLPLAGVVIEDFYDGASTVSQPDGTFLLQTRTPIPDEDPYYYYYGWIETVLTFTHPDYHDRGEYSYETREELNVVLRPLVSASPPNDDFANRLLLAGWPALGMGTTCGADAEPGDPLLGYQSVWFEWTAPTNGPVLVRLSPEHGDDLEVVIFTGTDLANLTQEPLNPLQGFFDPLQGYFEATEGTTYIIAVGSWDEQRVSPFTLELAALPRLTVHTPVDGILIQSGVVDFSIELSDPNLLVSRVNIDVAYSYEDYYYGDDYWSRTAKSVASLVPTGPLNFLWREVEPGEYPMRISMVDAEGVPLGWETRMVTVEPGNQDVEHAIELTGRSSAVQGSTVRAATGGVWYRWTAPYSGPATFQVSKTGDSSRNDYYYYSNGNPFYLEFYSGTSESDLDLLAMSDNGLLTWHAEAGGTYYLYVSSFGLGERFFLNLTPSSPPMVSVTSPPEFVTWSTLTNLTLEVDAQDLDGFICRLDYRVKAVNPYYYAYYYYGPPAGQGDVIASSTNAPFCVTLSSLPDGHYVLWAEAFDNLGLRGVTPNVVEFEVQATQVSNLGEHVDALGLAWLSGGTQPWETSPLVHHDGVDAAQSGPVDNGEQSWLETTVVGPGTLSFWWKLSSPYYEDYLEFYIDGDLLAAELYGETDWQQESIEIPSGVHALRWRYSKDFYGYGDRTGRGWLDEVAFVPDGP